MIDPVVVVVVVLAKNEKKGVPSSHRERKRDILCGKRSEETSGRLEIEDGAESGKDEFVRW